MRKNEAQMPHLEHVCNDIAGCRMPWRMLVRPLLRSVALHVCWGASDMAERRVWRKHVCIQRSMPDVCNLKMYCAAVRCTLIADLHDLIMTCACGIEPQPLARPGQYGGLAGGCRAT